MTNRRHRRRSRRPRRGFADYLAAAFLMIATALAAAWLDASNSQSLTGSVSVIDGDSLRLATREVRLVGIDAPEFNQTCERDGSKWPCGRAARAHLRHLVNANQPVTCTGSVTDKYDRLLGVCTGRGIDLNAAMVRDGMASAFGNYSAEEAAARAEKTGLWAGSFQRPQDYRASRSDDVFEEDAVSVVSRVRLWASQAIGWLSNSLDRLAADGD